MAYKQRWEEYFSVLDADNSGFLDPKDIHAATKYYARIMHEPEDSLHVAAVVTAQATFLQLLINDYDSNKDGKVSKAEFMDAVEKVLIKPPDEVPEWWKQSVQHAFNAGDVHSHGEISEEDMIHSINLINPNEKDEDIKHAFAWATKESGGKYDYAAHFKVSYAWATSNDITPEATILTPYFRKIEKNSAN